MGFHPKAIQHRIRVGRLHRLFPGVYAVGRAELTDHGRWMAAVLAGGVGAVLSHESAAALWAMRKHPAGAIRISVPAPRNPRQAGIRVHRRALLPAAHLTAHHNIPVTDPALTLVHLSLCLGRDSLEAAINEPLSTGTRSP